MNNRPYYPEIFTTSRKFYHKIFILKQNKRNHERIEFIATKCCKWYKLDHTLYINVQQLAMMHYNHGLISSLA